MRVAEVPRKQRTCITTLVHRRVLVAFAQNTPWYNQSYSAKGGYAATATLFANLDTYNLTYVSNGVTTTCMLAANPAAPLPPCVSLLNLDSNALFAFVIHIGNASSAASVS